MDDLRSFSSNTFESDVLGAEEPVLVDFFASWCPPCKMMDPLIRELAQQYAGRITVGKLDVDANPDLRQRYDVLSIPTLGVFSRGELIERLVGYPGPGVVRAFVDKNAG